MHQTAAFFEHHARDRKSRVQGPGSGCAKCNTLEASTKAALAQLGMDTSIDHVTDFAKIAAYGVMTTPALVVDGKVVSFGKVLKPDEVAAILRKVRG
ncbi:MAG: thioredoxin family protein [Clostridiales bacterium]|nr:thioredoxin family protein [Clostridiales bacterium]